MSKLCRCPEQSEPHVTPEGLSFSARDHCALCLGLPSVGSKYGKCRGLVGHAGCDCQFESNPVAGQGRPGDARYLDEIIAKISDRRYWLWRAADQHGVVLDEILQPKRDKRAAKRLLRTESANAGGILAPDAVASALSQEGHARSDAVIGPTISTIHHFGGQRLSMFGTIAQFSTVTDVTLDDMKIELFFRPTTKVPNFCVTLPTWLQIR